MRSHTWSALRDKKLAQLRWSRKIRIILDIFIHYCVVSGQIESIPILWNFYWKWNWYLPKTKYHEKPGSRGSLLTPSPVRTVRDRLPSGNRGQIFSLFSFFGIGLQLVEIHLMPTLRFNPGPGVPRFQQCAERFLWQVYPPFCHPTQVHRCLGFRPL